MKRNKRQKQRKKTKKTNENLDFEGKYKGEFRKKV